MDFKSAFDTVSHEKLLYKLISYGITGHFLLRLTALLTNRKQVVVINNATSELASVRSGVPEGSVIGPLLFLIYINDIGDGLKCCFYKLFADDLKIYYMFNYVDGNIAINGLQKDLILIEKFAHIWQLIKSIAKTYIMHVGFKNPNFKYFLNGVEVQCKEVANDLGILIRNDLSFDDHINTMCTKAYKVINSLFRCFCCKKIDVYVKAYLAYVRSILEYSTCIWSPYKVGLINMIEKVQKYFTRRLFIRCKIPHMHYYDRLQYLNLNTLELRRLHFDMYMCYNIMKSFVTCNLSDNLKLDNNNLYNLRGHCFKLFTSFSNLNVRKYFFVNRIVQLWNRLPESIICTNNSKTFYNHLSGIDMSLHLHCHL